MECLMNENIFRKIVYFGNLYRNGLSNNFPRNQLEADWYSGLSLLLDHSFYQGRRDDVSDMVKKAATPILDGYFKNKDVAALLTCNFESLFNDLTRVIGKGKVGKERDIRMIISIFDFVKTLPEKNLILYCVREIQEGRIHGLYSNLMVITQVGPKVASFYLRDLVDIYDLENYIQKDYLRYLQPIDVWVRRVANRIGIVADVGLGEEDIRECILRACADFQVSAFRFNQGAWYVGKNAFEILMKYLGDIDVV